MGSRQNMMEFYLDNKKTITDYGILLMSCVSIDNIIENPTFEEYEVISSASYNAYMKDESYLDIMHITDQICFMYKNHDLTLDEISHMASRDMLEIIEDYGNECEEDYEL